MINFNKYENSERLRKLDSFNVVVHDNMNTLKDMFTSLTDDVVYSSAQLELVNQINDLIRIESQTNSIWEKLTTKLISSLKTNELDSNERLSQEIDEIAQIGELSLESNVRSNSLSRTLANKFTSITSHLYKVIGVGSVASLLSAITFYEVGLPSVYSESLLLFCFVVFLCACCFLMNMTFIDSKLRIMMTEANMIKTLTISLIIFGIVGLNPISLICGIYSGVYLKVHMTNQNLFEQLKKLESIQGYNVSYIVDYINDDYYISKLLGLTQNFPKGVSEQTSEKLQRHLNQMRDSIDIINNY